MSYRKERRKQLALIYVLGTLAILLVTAVTVALLRSDKEKLRNEGIKEYKAGHYEEAIKLFKESLSENQLFSDRMDLDTRMYLGTAQLKLGQYREAEKTFIILHKENDGTINSGKIDTFLGIAEAMQGFGDLNPATVIPKYEAAVKDGNYSALLYLAASYYATEEYDLMLQAYMDYIDKVGMNTYVAYQISSYYLKNNDYESASAYIERGLQCDDDLFADKLQYNQVVCYESKYDYDKAFQLMSELHTNYPDNEEYKAEYDYLYTRVNIDPVPVIDTMQDEEE